MLALKARLTNLPKAAMLLSISLASGSCSFNHEISNQSLDFNSTIETVTDSILISNILRARDGDPLFFSDISQIRGSISGSLQAQTSIPFGPRNRPSSGTGIRSTLQNTLQIQTNPTFDISPANTKQFYLGILEPLSGKTLAYYLQRGVDPDWVFNLMISQIEVIQRYDKHDHIIKTYKFPDPNLKALIDTWSSIDPKTAPRIIFTSDTKRFGPRIPISSKAIIDAKANGFSIDSDDDIDTNSTKSINAKHRTHAPTKNDMQLLLNSSHLRICVSRGVGQGFSPLEILENSIANTPTPDVVTSAHDCNENAPTTEPTLTNKLTKYRVRMRSVESIFYYLGAIGVDNSNPPIPFYISSKPNPPDRFSIRYLGTNYYVKTPSDENDHKVKNDQTLAILVILNDLLNINRDASEIPTTKAVQSVGAN